MEESAGWSRTWRYIEHQSVYTCINLLSLNRDTQTTSTSYCQCSRDAVQEIDRSIYSEFMSLSTGYGVIWQDREGLQSREGTSGSKREVRKLNLTLCLSTKAILLFYLDVGLINISIKWQDIPQRLAQDSQLMSLWHKRILVAPALRRFQELGDWRWIDMYVDTTIPSLSCLVFCIYSVTSFPCHLY